MKVFRPFIFIVFTLVALSMVQSDRKVRVQACAEKAGEGAFYLREFVVSLPRAVKYQPPPVYRRKVILRANNIYRFNLCNYRGQAIIRIYNRSELVVSSHDSSTRKERNPINFLCRKTGQYTIMIYFKDGTAGEAIGIMSHVMH
jgi:hypothetical protein